MDVKLVAIIFFTIIIHTSETLAYSIRLGGVKLRKIAVSLSLTGIVLLVSRTSNLVQAPLLGGVIDSARVDQAINVEGTFRLVLLSASAGTLLALVLFPTFTKLAIYVIKRFEAEGSVFALVSATNISKLKKTGSYVRRPRFQMFEKLRVGGIPKRIMLMNMIVTAIYTTGILSALYASLVSPDHSTASSMATGLINGFATILLTLVLDPRIALLTEKALTEEGGADNMAKMYGWLMISRFCGTLLAQLLFLPAAYWIAWVSGVLS
ncbi:DUF2837 family protein [Bacillus infantis]|uniref:Lipid II flippase Amj n=1 Tax=Bacillus infantis TaxID=324767 RepID=A0A5D4SNS0_9BACI|nr:lipid II flippase Amj family protein [Bacillus infantis]TYS63974.1 DUF2837 family protein [Bacillus infantis]